MRGWMIPALILLILFLLSRLRLGGTAEYSAAGFAAWIRMGGLRLRVFPRKPKKKRDKPKKPKKEDRKKKDTREKSAGTKPGGAVSLVLDCLPLVGEAARRLKRKLRIDRLYLDLTVGNDDPADAVDAYGRANAALGILIPFLEQNFDLRDRRIRTAVDFELEKPAIYLNAALSYTLGQLLAFVFWLGISFLRIFLAWRKEQKAKTVSKQKEAVNNGK